MPQQGPLNWLDGNGWLIVSGGGDVLRGDIAHIDTRLLSLINLDRPMVVLLEGGARQDADDVLDYYTALGGPIGEAFALNTLTREHFFSADFLTLLEEAGTLYICGDNPLPLLQYLYKTPAMERIQRGFTTLQALTIMVTGGNAATIGKWAIGPAPDYLQAIGLDFLKNTVVEPYFTRTEDAVVLRNINQLGPGILGLGIPERTALAFGPQGQVETWGQQPVTVVVSTSKPDAGRA